MKNKIERTEERRNRFTNERAFLTKEEAELHDLVFFYEALEQYSKMQKCISKFREFAWCNSRHSGPLRARNEGSNHIRRIKSA